MSVIGLLKETRRRKSPAKTPPEFRGIKKKFSEAMENGTPILIENSSYNLTQSIVIQIEYVGDRWCMGETTYFRYGKEEKVPYTISYVDLFVNDNSTTIPKIIFKGANPFD